MADKPTQEPSFGEMLAAQKEPSFEEMLAAEQPEGPAGLSVFEEPLSPSEAALRFARQGFKGASLGLSEPLFGASAAVTGAVEDLVSGGDAKGAQSVLDAAKARYKQDIERQEKFAAEYPMMAGSAEVVGGVAPLFHAGLAEALNVSVKPSIAEKMAGLGLEGVSSIPGLLKQSALTGAATGGVMEGAEQLTKAPYESLSAEESAKRLGMAAATGGVVGAGLSGLGVGIGKAITSEPSQTMVQVISGIKKDTQKQFMARVKEIENLPSDEAVAEFFENVRNQLLRQENLTVQKLASADSNLIRIDAKLAATEASAKADQRARLQMAREELKSIREDLGREMSGAKKAFDQEKQMLEKDLIDPEMTPHVKRVEDSLDALKDKIFQKSSEATELLPKEPVFNREEILQAIAREKSGLTKGAGKAIVPEVKSAIGLLDGIAKEVSEMAPMLTGPEVKGIIKQLDAQVSQMLPGRYAKLADVPLYQVRKQIDRTLKSIAPEYGAFMEKEVAPLAAFHEEALSRLKSPSMIETQTRKSLREPEVGKIFSRLKDETGIDTIETIMDLADKRQARSMKQWMLQSTPEAMEITRLQNLIDMSRQQNFNAAVFQNVKDQEAGQAIIKLRRTIGLMQNKELQEQEINSLLQSGRIDLAEAEALKSNLKKELDQIRSLVDPMSKDKHGGQTLGTILRQASAPNETRAASRLIDAITQLPEEQFGELFKSINVANPQAFERVAENLRLRRALDMPRTQGSRRVQLANNMVGALADASGLAKGGPLMKAVAGFVGAYLDEFGGAAAKAYLKAGLNLQGLPTAEKLLKVAPIPMSTRLKNQISGYIGNMASEVDPEELFPVSEQQREAVLYDLKSSKLSPVERAKAITELSQLNGISGKYLRKIMLDAPVKKAQSEEFLKTQQMGERKEMALKMDKPDVLAKMAMRT